MTPSVFQFWHEKKEQYLPPRDERYAALFNRQKAEPQDDSGRSGGSSITFECNVAHEMAPSLNHLTHL